MVSQSREILQTFVWCGAQTCKNRNFLLSLSIASMVQRVSIKVGWSQRETKELLSKTLFICHTKTYHLCKYLLCTPKIVFHTEKSPRNANVS